MIFGIIVLVVALTISAVAEYYSIIGLTTIFSGAFWPVVIMGCVLALGKLASIVWVHLNWKRAPWRYKLYLMSAVAVLMFITSMGIFGFLSKSHADQIIPVGAVVNKVAIIDEKIKNQRDNIDSARKALAQMDAQVNQRLDRSNDEKGAERAVQIRRQQATERTNLQKEITKAQTEIGRLNDERAPIATELRKVEADVGPIKYIAALIYGDNPDATLLDRAVRYVIILLVTAFDPLALTLLLAGTMCIEWANEDKMKRAEVKEFKSISADSKELDIPVLTERIVQKVEKTPESTNQIKPSVSEIPKTVDAMPQQLDSYKESDSTMQQSITPTKKTFFARMSIPETGLRRKSNDAQPVEAKPRINSAE